MPHSKYDTAHNVLCALRLIAHFGGRKFLPKVKERDNKERNAYEEKKLKLRLAIADITLGLKLEAMDDRDALRLRRLDAAVKNDDWSSAIDSQTQETTTSDV